MDELIKEMQSCIDGISTEDNHIKADNLLIQALLIISGDNNKVVKLIQLYDKVGKWYS